MFCLFVIFCCNQDLSCVGTSLRPRISTGVDGPASFTLLPCHPSWHGLTGACAGGNEVTYTQGSFLYQDRATGPFPLSSSASITRPLAILFGLAFSSETSAVRRIISRRSRYPPRNVRIPVQRWCFRPSLPESAHTRIIPVLLSQYWHSA